MIGAVGILMPYNATTHFSMSSFWKPARTNFLVADLRWSLCTKAAEDMWHGW